MANEDKKPEIKKPKFNSYWVYAVIIMVFLGIQIFGGGSWSQPNKTTQADFEQYLKDGDVDKIEIVNRKVAKVYPGVDPAVHATGRGPGALAGVPIREAGRGPFPAAVRVGGQYVGRAVAHLIAFHRDHWYLDLHHAEDVIRCRRGCWRANIQHREVQGQAFRS